jgi:hypothetical protein
MHVCNISYVFVDINCCIYTTSGFCKKTRNDLFTMSRGATVINKIVLFTTARVGYHK